LAALARDGIYKGPRLIWEPGNSEGEELGILLEALAIMYDGMSTIVKEASGTAYTEFESFLATLTAEDVKVYSKTARRIGQNTPGS